MPSISIFPDHAIPPPEASKIIFPNSFCLLHLTYCLAGVPAVHEYGNVLQYLKCHALTVWHFCFLSLTFFVADLLSVSGSIFTFLIWRGFHRMISSRRPADPHPVQLPIYYSNFTSFFNHKIYSYE